MEILVRRIGGDVKVVIEGGENQPQLDIGLCNHERCLDIANKFILAAEDILPISHSFHEDLLETIRRDL